jgi:hypothetical protein
VLVIVAVSTPFAVKVLEMTPVDVAPPTATVIESAAPVQPAVLESVFA